MIRRLVIRISVYDTDHNMIIRNSKSRYYSGRSRGGVI